MKYQDCSAILLIFLIAFTAPTVVIAQGEPTIAPEIGRLIAEQGIDAAQIRFEELSKSELPNANLEIQGLHTLMGAYMQAGNHAAAEAVANMAGQLTQKMIMQSMPGMAAQMEAMQKAEEAAKAQQEANRASEQQLEQKRQAQSRGKSREDLGRFKGLYGEKGSSDLGKTVFVTVSCDGYLVAGPMWADVSPWWMRSAADMVFTYADSWTSISMEFVSGDNNKVDLLKHDIEGIGNPLEWKKQLSGEFDKCIERPVR